MMRILVTGATGGTGREVVSQALKRGHRVNALARSAADAAPLLPGADIIEGDAQDREAVAKALSGCDGVISALGTKLALFHKETTLSNATRVLIDAMHSQGIKHLVCITGIGAGDSRGHDGFFYDHIAQPLLLRSTYQDKDRQEHEVRKSGLSWTIVRPPGTHERTSHKQHPRNHRFDRLSWGYCWALMLPTSSLLSLRSRAGPGNRRSLRRQIPSDRNVLHA